MKVTIFVLPLALAALLSPAMVRAVTMYDTIPLKAGTVIDRSGRVAPGRYLLPSEDETGKSAAVTIRGDNLTVDFSGAELRGTPPETEPDQRKGAGIRVEGRNITLKNLRVHGYKIGLFAAGCTDLKILGGDLSFNWKQHLGSTREREDESDWQSYHHNEQDEWLRYGAALYLHGCDRFEVKGVTAQGGQCGLMLTRCTHGLVWNNDFSFLSGVGLGLYRSSDNRVMHNRIDFCVRGFSYGVYNRGQDSAGILVYEQSCRNLFAYNSVTHGGDGFFLWAGQTTMDTGQGGCNDNLVYGNDFSFAPTNGIEATFSRNKFINNRVEECDNGFWGGYSYDTLVLNNDFAGNNRAIAIEHGQHNAIRFNSFRNDGDAISLWQNPTQDPNWGYPKHHDTVSHDYTIRDNLIVLPQRLALSLRGAKDVRFVQNTLLIRGTDVMKSIDADGLIYQNNILVHDAPAQSRSGNTRRRAAETTAVSIPPWLPAPKPGEAPAEVSASSPGPLEGAINAFKGRGQWRGKRTILVDEWGPYDFRFPRLEPLPRDLTASDNTLYFDVLGPAGAWRVLSVQGGTLSAQSGGVPGKLAVKLTPGKATDLRIKLEYVGAAVRDYRGVETPKGQPVAFGFRQFSAPVSWNVRFFVYTPETDPRAHPDAFEKLIQGKPVAELTTGRLRFAGMGAFAPGVPANYFATIADGEIELPQGAYTLEIVSDDGCRVDVDGKRVIDAWRYQVPTRYSADLTLGGKYKIHVEHFQIDGYATLQLELRPKP